MDINQKILDYCMENWSKRFDGISSYNVAEKLGIDHNKVRKVFKNLLEQNKGTLHENIVLKPLRLNSNKPSQEILTTVFFPAKESLKENFNKHGFSEKNFPEFKKRLQLGHRRNELAYFSKSVLKRYFSFADKFTIQDSLFGGFLCGSRNDEKVTDQEKNRQHSFTLRFGKRKLDKSEQVVTAILDDLAELPETEQQHWYFSEIEQPNFSFFDHDFHKYYLRYYHGIPVQTRDPLNRLLDMMKKINTLPNVRNLFKKVDDTQLKYPVNKSREEFCAEGNKLYQVIGPENLNALTLKKFLSVNYNYSDEDFFDKEKGRPLEVDQLFSKFLWEIDFLEYSIDTLMNEVKENFIKFGLQNKKYLNSPDFLGTFRNICQSLLISYTILYEKLKT